LIFINGNVNPRNACKEAYNEGYLAKLLFKKVILPSGIFEA